MPSQAPNITYIEKIIPPKLVFNPEAELLNAGELTSVRNDCHAGRRDGSAGYAVIASDIVNGRTGGVRRIPEESRCRFIPVRDIVRYAVASANRCRSRSRGIPCEAEPWRKGAAVRHLTTVWNSSRATRCQTVPISQIIVPGPGNKILVCVELSFGAWIILTRDESGIQ